MFCYGHGHVLAYCRLGFFFFFLKSSSSLVGDNNYCLRVHAVHVINYNSYRLGNDRHIVLFVVAGSFLFSFYFIFILGSVWYCRRHIAPQYDPN